MDGTMKTTHFQSFLDHHRSQPSVEQTSVLKYHTGSYFNGWFSHSVTWFGASFVPIIGMPVRLSFPQSRTNRSLILVSIVYRSNVTQQHAHMCERTFLILGKICTRKEWNSLTTGFIRRNTFHSLRLVAFNKHQSEVHSWSHLRIRMIWMNDRIHFFRKSRVYLWFFPLLRNVCLIRSNGWIFSQKIVVSVNDVNVEGKQTRSRVKCAEMESRWARFRTSGGLNPTISCFNLSLWG